VAGAARLSVLSGGRCAGICPARSACAYERLREPETGRGVMAFCWVVVAGKRSVLRLIVEGGTGWRLLQGICDIIRLEGRATPLGDRGMPEPDGVGKRPRGKECRGAPVSG
jgi:hypothetical protein